MTSEEAKKFKVIEIVNDELIIVDVGTQDGFQEGDTVVIFEKGREVIDKTSNTPLGTWDTIKAKMTIIQAFPQFSVCASLKVVYTSLLNPLSTQPKYKHTTYKKLSVDKEDMTQNYPSGDLTIHVGDEARPEPKLLRPE